MLIYCKQYSPRLQYIVNTLFGSDVIITSEVFALQEYNEQKVCYDAEKLCSKALWIVPHGLLFENNIAQLHINCTTWNNTTVFFQTNGDVPFDFFSAAFFLLSRYEEYLPHKKDTYGRYAHTESLAYKNNFLDIPIINEWLEKLNFTSNAPQPTPNFLPTYDVDIAYAFKGHNLFINIARVIKQMLKGNFTAIKNLFSNKDVFDVYEWLDNLHNKHSLAPHYFFLVANKRSTYDKNISPSSKAMKALIQNISANYKTALHPSWQSFGKQNILNYEKKTLEKISGKKISASRQHYIKMQLPETYKTLIKSSITEDYSMGYATANGFRAGYCNSFLWYDLSEEKTTKLLLTPFCYMDATSRFANNKSAEEALEDMITLYNTVKKHNGTFSSIFHNHFLSERSEDEEWRGMYEKFMQTIHE